MIRAVMRRSPLARLLSVIALLATAALVSACGSQGNDVLKSASASPDVKAGSQLFSERCSGCHTLDVGGAEGSATLRTDRERVDGPNFNQRKECAANVLYALANGGYSGAIMPENIVVGQDAKDVAAFLEKYSGSQVSVAAGAKRVTCQPSSGG
jgi:mono/diheme cytochrome c family protein